MLVSDEQPEKKLDSIEVQLLGSVMLVSEGQAEKVPVAILVTLL